MLSLVFPIQTPLGTASNYNYMICYWLLFSFVLLNIELESDWSSRSLRRFDWRGYYGVWKLLSDGVSTLVQLLITKIEEFLSFSPRLNAKSWQFFIMLLFEVFIIYNLSRSSLLISVELLADGKSFSFLGFELNFLLWLIGIVMDPLLRVKEPEYI